MKVSNKKFIVHMIILFVFLLATIPLCALWGTADISYSDTVKLLVYKFIPGLDYTGPDYIENIIWQLRIPRILLGLAVGGGLSISGVLMQALTQNMLADPYILGVSSGASATAVFVIAFGSGTWLGNFGISGAAFLGAFLSLLIVYVLSIKDGKSSTSRLLLSGVAVSMVLNALTQFLIMMAPSGSTKNAIYWMMGSLAGARWNNVLLPCIVSVIGLCVTFVISSILNLISLGDDTATTMGINANSFRKFLLVLVSILAGIIVSSSGCVGFVGLMIPHIARMCYGSNHKRVTIASFLIGGIFLTWMDVLARTILAPAEISIGILTAFCGGPFFIWLMRVKNR